MRAILLIPVLWAGVEAAELPPHPRLLFPAAAEPAVRARIAADPLAALVRDAVVARATAMLGERVCEHRIPDGKRLLGESRLALNNVLHTAMAWRLTGQERFRERCIRELDAAAGLKDWNPPHFLDTAEMAAAVAIGYDWLHATLDEGRRARYREALVEKALVPGREVYRKGGWWTSASNNWGQVCAAGLSFAAIALAAEEPAWLETILVPSREVIARSLRFYEPDGLYPEGPGYWDYGTNFHVMFCAMQEVLGEKPAGSAGFAAAGDFMTHAHGPGGLAFNFADSGTGSAEPSAARSWLAARHPQAAWRGGHVRRLLAAGAENLRRHGSRDRFFPLHLLWLPAPGDEAARPPLAAAFRGQQAMAAFRSSWDDRDALFLAVKGGTPAASHGQMDVGSFVLDANGQRWAHDLGTDDYNLPGYFGGRRWDYFRLQNRSHNTLVIGDRLQNPKAAPCPLGTVSVAGPGPFAAAFDLAAAYAGQAEAVERKAEFDPRKRVATLTDTLRGALAPVRWGMVTAAEVAVSGRQAVLTQKGRRLRVDCLEPAGAAWQVLPAAPPTKEERRNDGYRILAFTVPPAADLRLVVRFTAE
jgi:hypothetical protein